MSKSVSDMAEHCPNCGYPIKLQEASIESSENQINPKEYPKAIRKLTT